MRWIGLTLALAIFAGTTGWAVVASTQGWGLPGLLEQPVNIRQQSTSGRHRRHGGAAFIYFGSRRSHYGGSYGHGK